MLEKLRAKPNHIKKSIALFLAAVISVIIFFVWVSSWDARTNGDAIRGKTVSPLSGFSTMLDGFMSDVREGVSGVPTYVENTPSPTIDTATTSPSFDFSSVIVIDSSASTTTSTSTSAR
ncbi:MAG: hypothetical protein A2937_00680 [Candidatus Yonathbacteria bacterium RIFCSPLOWO2_01_FULL_47_33b]|uniref:Uncharacterized protein n=1 Tax=Candidatus Yonathbacteria bacterium RIFCSPLOWO2_01_FULL_47_33b TaxID=1802727 RepID=A0A1G2SF76_9BACT|nr:MAG: hypothetical protein A2937_00680 [Candidatus Yonathbacteria bacterium RIFCSPLOWO2_01_FULL_47_33b]